MPEVLPDTQESPRDVVEMLDTLFLRALDWTGLSMEAEGLPEHLAASFGSNPDEGLEILKLVNWRNKRSIEVIRPTLDAADLDQVTSPDGSVGFSYRISMEDLFGRSFVMSSEVNGTENDDDDDETIVSHAGYDVYSQKIIVWGIGTETTFFCPVDDTSPDHALIVGHISHVLDLKALTKDFELSPSFFED